MRKRDGDRFASVEPLADARSETRQTKQAAGRQSTDGHDQPWLQEAQLPLAPERAELLLAWRRGTVSPSGGGLPRVTARHRRAVERAIESLLVELEPAAQVLAGAPAPGSVLRSFDGAGRLPVEVGALAV